MDADAQYMSREKYDALKREYAELKEEKIPTIAKRIDDARQMGDLSENAEYHTAREEMAWAQSKLKELDYFLNNSEIIRGKMSDSVTIGSVATVLLPSGLEKEYRIVGAQEADPLKGNISNESPLGQAFLGHKKGDRVDVRVPSGVQTYEILKVS